jgi:hypothetical protein
MLGIKTTQNQCERNSTPWWLEAAGHKNGYQQKCDIYTDFHLFNVSCSPCLKYLSLNTKSWNDLAKTKNRTSTYHEMNLSRNHEPLLKKRPICIRWQMKSVHIWNCSTILSKLHPAGSTLINQPLPPVKALEDLHCWLTDWPTSYFQFDWSEIQLVMF